MGARGAARAVNYLPVSARFGNVEAFFIRSTVWPFGGRPFREDEAGEEEGSDGEGELHSFYKFFGSVDLFLECLWILFFKGGF